jgi:hypothetical protein
MSSLGHGRAPRGVLFKAVLWAALWLAPAQAAVAAELVMFTRDGCPWCARFEREVAPSYALTAEGRQAPLRRLEVRPGGVSIPGLREPVIATPTFVLMDGEREIGRITGYLANDMFWGLLGKMLADIEKPVGRTGAVSATMESQ